jgi:hypothetical protein
VAIGGLTLFGCLISSRGLFAQPAANEVPKSDRTFWLQGWVRKKVQKLGLFLSQHLTDHIALRIRNVAISEKLLVQRNIFLTNKRVERNHYSRPPATNMKIQI